MHMHEEYIKRSQFSMTLLTKIKFPESIFQNFSILQENFENLPEIMNSYFAEHQASKFSIADLFQSEPCSRVATTNLFFTGFYY